MKNVKNNQTAKRPLIPWSFKSQLMLLALVFLLGFIGNDVFAQSWSSANREGVGSNPYNQFFEDDNVILTFDFSNASSTYSNGRTVMFSTVDNPSNPSTDLHVTLYDDNGGVLISYAYSSNSGEDLIPTAATYNTFTKEYLVCGNYTGTSPATAWYLVFDVDLSVTPVASGILIGLTNPVTSTTDDLMITAVCARTDGSNNFDYCFTGRSEDGGFLTTNGHMFIMELESSTGNTNYLDIQNATGGSPWLLGAEGFPACIIEVKNLSTTHSGYFIGGNSDLSAFYARADYGLTQFTACKLTDGAFTPVIKLNGMSMSYNPNTDRVIVAGSTDIGSVTSLINNLFVDVISQVTTSTTWAPYSNFFYGTYVFSFNTAAGLPIIGIDNSTLSNQSSGAFGSQGYPYTNGLIQERYSLDGTQDNDTYYLGFRLKETDYALTNAAYTINANNDLPGWFYIDYDNLIANPSNWSSTNYWATGYVGRIYPRLSGNANGMNTNTVTYYTQVKAAPASQFLPYHQMSFQDAFATQGRFSNILTKDESTGTEETALVQNEQDYGANNCLVIKVADVRDWFSIAGFNFSSFTITSPVSITNNTLNVSDYSTTISSDLCPTSSYKTTKTENVTNRANSFELYTQSDKLLWIGEIDKVEKVILYDISGHKLYELGSDELMQFYFPSLANGMYLANIYYSDNTKQSQKLIIH